MAPKKGKIKEEVDIKPEDDDEDVGKKKNRPARAKKPTKKVCLPDCSPPSTLLPYPAGVLGTHCLRIDAVAICLGTM
jgi:hypothetical protein